MFAAALLLCCFCCSAAVLLLLFPNALPELGFSFRFWGAGVGERSRPSAAVGRGSPRCAGGPFLLRRRSVSAFVHDSVPSFTAQAQCFVPCMHVLSEQAQCSVRSDSTKSELRLCSFSLRKMHAVHARRSF